eukprot:TRINITY_DN15207_c0_g1_i1.p1 TRINITY_DN15207_c0_g1~~TRINITY_DN15207_c0_g1_i1.p1  ORF type:complete len:542 (-),score=82.74 TRINITY_DN15207_c0_g1_i1:23-1648(-)
MDRVHSVALLLLLFISITILNVSGINPVVSTQQGLVRGQILSDSISYLGIPYARPPVGDLRWAAPQPPHSWSPSVLNATGFPYGCPQRCVLPPHTCPEKQSEDCLYLGVYTPLTPSHSLLPVIVFFPGGRFEQGEAGVTLYSGSYFANKTNVITVVANYRLGALGLLKLPHMKGNYALDDQRFVLKWVQQNIQNFGGNPHSVTIAGQSAGAMSIGCHLFSPESKGLFQKAILESNPITLPMYSEYDAYWIAERFASDLNCDLSDIHCLRNASAAAVVDAEYSAQRHLDVFGPLLSFVPWTPVVVKGSTDLPINPLEGFLSPNIDQLLINNVPILWGQVLDEALMFIYLAWNGSLSVLESDVLLADVFTYRALSVRDMYPSTSGDQRVLMGQMGTDYIFACSVTKSLERMVDKVNGAQVYSYVFNHVLSFDAWGPRYPECRKYVCHGSELPFVFHSGEIGGYYKWTKEEAALSETMAEYWANFVTNGNPNIGARGKTPVHWGEFNGSNPGVLEFTTERTRMISGYRGRFCDFWNKMGYHWGY